MDTKNPRGRKLLVGEATTLLNLWTPQWSTTDVGWVTVGTNVLAYCRVSSRASQSSFTAVQLTFKSRPAVDVSKELSKSFSCNSHNLSSESCVIFKTFSSSIGHVLLELLATLLQYPPPPNDSYPQTFRKCSDIWTKLLLNTGHQAPPEDPQMNPSPTFWSIRGFMWSDFFEVNSLWSTLKHGITLSFAAATESQAY